MCVLWQFSITFPVPLLHKWPGVKMQSSCCKKTDPPLPKGKKNLWCFIPKSCHLYPFVGCSSPWTVLLLLVIIFSAVQCLCPCTALPNTNFSHHFKTQITSLISCQYFCSYSFIAWFTNISNLIHECITHWVACIIPLPETTWHLLN